VITSSNKHGKREAWMFREGVQAGVDLANKVDNEPEHLKDGSTEGVNKYQVENYNC
jgi:hypothetical protein